MGKILDRLFAGIKPSVFEQDKLFHFLKENNLDISDLKSVLDQQNIVVLNRNLEKIEEANKVYISNQGATLWQKKINLKNRNVAA